MKISKRTREDAARICEVIGNDRFAGPRTTGLVSEEMGASAAACDLADKAFTVIPEYGLNENGHYGIEWLEAAALLRDGWEPGDVPELLNPVAQAAVESAAPAIDYEDASDDEPAPEADDGEDEREVAPEPDYGYDDGDCDDEGGES